MQFCGGVSSTISRVDMVRHESTSGIVQCSPGSSVRLYLPKRSSSLTLPERTIVGKYACAVHSAARSHAKRNKAIEREVMRTGAMEEQVRGDGQKTLCYD